MTRRDDGFTVDEIACPSSGDLSLSGLARRYRWPTLVAMAVANSEEIALADKDGMTVLHWACCNSPPAWTIESLLRFKEPAKKAAFTRDRNGLTPLASACASQAPLEVISLLANTFPETLYITDDDGWNPLHYVCCNTKSCRDPDYITESTVILLRGDVSLGMARDNIGRIPLEVLANTYELELIGLRRFLKYLPAGEYKKRDMLLHDVYRLLCLICEFTIPANGGSPLHCISAYPGCPGEMVKFAMAKKPNLIKSRDADRNTPLHAAVAAETWPAVSALAEEAPVMVTARNNKGETPLQMAFRTASKWNDAMLDLMEADTASLISAEIDDTAYHFLLGHAASRSHQIVFEMLVAKPNLVRKE